jgi:signal peptidase I
MAPLLEKGDAVVVQRTDPANLQAGDLVSLLLPNGDGLLVTHRVLWVDQAAGRIVTKGDANATADPATDVTAVVGKVQYKLAGAGYIIDGLRSWPGLVLAVYAPLALLLASELRRVGRYYGRPTYRLHGIYK